MFWATQDFKTKGLNSEDIVILDDGLLRRLCSSAIIQRFSVFSFTASTTSGVETMDGRAINIESINGSSGNEDCRRRAARVLFPSCESEKWGLIIS